MATPQSANLEIQISRGFGAFCPAMKKITVEIQAFTVSARGKLELTGNLFIHNTARFNNLPLDTYEVKV